MTTMARSGTSHRASGNALPLVLSASMSGITSAMETAAMAGVIAAGSNTHAGGDVASTAPMAFRSHLAA